MRSSGVFIGDGSLLIRCAELFLGAGHAIAGVSSDDQRIRDWARQHRVEIIDGDFDAAVAEPAPQFDFLFSIANYKIIPADTIARARRLAINFHDSVLPRYAGYYATSWALISGENTHGVTWHEMTAKVDAGRVLQQTSFSISSDETAFSLNAKCYEAGVASFERIVADIGSDQLTLSPQIGERSYFGRQKRPPMAAVLDFKRPAAESERLIRALDFGPYPNPLGRAKLQAGNQLVAVRSAGVQSRTSSAAPGTVLQIDRGSICVATSTDDLQLSGLATVDGTPVSSAAEFGISVGGLLRCLDEDDDRSLAAAFDTAARSEPFWIARLGKAQHITLPYPRRSDAEEGTAKPISRTVARSKGGNTAGRGQSDGNAVVAAFAGWISRLTDQASVSFSYSDPIVCNQAKFPRPWFADHVVVSLKTENSVSPAQLVALMSQEAEQVRQAGPFLSDLPSRLLTDSDSGGASRRAAIGVIVATAPDHAQALMDRELVLAVDPDGSRTELIADGRVYPEAVFTAMADHFDCFLHTFLSGDGRPLGEMPLAPDHELMVRDKANDTKVPLPADQCIHQAIVAQADRTPDKLALICGEGSMTYRELDRRIGSFAARLVSLGVSKGAIVGLCIERSANMVVAMLAIQKAGAAYLPLDPAFPKARIDLMINDAGVSHLVTSRAVGAVSDIYVAHVVTVDDERAETDMGSESVAFPTVSAEDLAYVIYTSGSTGRPKGVAITHRNVMNFFAGMDARIPHDGNGVWLAATGISFDISVLELLWTLARGFTVVVHRDALPKSRETRPEFSLFYWSNDDAQSSGDKYRLVIEGSKFADREGFAAVWTPERHFHAFGGQYPNPVITSTAIAMATSRVDIRAGSVVLPLHNPVQVAEDWAVVDNLSQGRVGVSFATGWQPDDFVLAPDAFANRKSELFAQIEQVQELWRGNKIKLRNPHGELVEVGTYPRPVQKDLPIWLTCAGNPETYELAGRHGFNVLTHLLGQSFEELSDKIRLYREARSTAGHSGNGHVTLMLHTFVGPDDERVLETVRGRLKEYLGSALNLVGKAGWSFPTMAEDRDLAESLDAEPLSQAELDAMLDHAFERYYQTSGLLGTPERCLPTVEKAMAIGVDEIGCLVDFGLPTDTVLEHLPYLKQVVDDVGGSSTTLPELSISEEITAHGVTHFQCTPSMASMLVADAAGKSAISSLQAMLVGGEALSVPLARQLRSCAPGVLLNMYGPTETTIWSSTCTLETIGDFVPLGVPIANTQLYVLDPHGKECPSYVAGELHIGGEGVGLGYLNRTELTKERFVCGSDTAAADARLYRTGDVVRRHPDGALEFLGRSDHQVKIRGHRVELGEIEAAIAGHPGVAAAVVLAREDVEDDKRLTAYLTVNDGEAPTEQDLRRLLQAKLPAFMVPSTVMMLDAFPLTMNGKVDRDALPSPRRDRAPRPQISDSPAEAVVAAIWCDVLGLPQVGTSDNFFDVGGHSLLAVKVQRRLQAEFGREIPLVDVFRHPTVRALAEHLGGNGADQSAVTRGIDRARRRRARHAPRNPMPIQPAKT